MICFSQKPGAFNTKCVQLIGKCFRDLEKLSIGGYDVDLSSLVFIGKHLHFCLAVFNEKLFIFADKEYLQLPSFADEETCPRKI